VRKLQPKVVILDRMFNSEDSIDCLQTIKTLVNPPMILMLTALDGVRDRVAGLKEGADDYLCKPFDFDELLARITALTRRYTSNHENQNAEQIVIGQVVVKPSERSVTLAQKEVALTKIEFDLLLYFLDNQDKALSRERILARVWGATSDPNTNIVDVYISRLRKKFEPEPKFNIKTLRGSGYRYTAAE
jgi:two-component system response regulator PrrA